MDLQRGVFLSCTVLSPRDAFLFWGAQFPGLFEQPGKSEDSHKIPYCLGRKKGGCIVDSLLFVDNVYLQLSRGLKTNMDANVFQVTEKADQMIQQFFQEKKEKPIVRVFLSQGG